MATKNNKNLETGGATKQTGYAFVSSSLEPYHVPAVNAKTIYEISDNIYVAGPVTQTTNLVIAGKPVISAYDEKGDPVEDLSRDLNLMFDSPSCSMSAIARSALADMLVWGVSIYNWVWIRQNGRLVCSELTRLSPYLFSQAPSGSKMRKTFGRLLKGIVYDMDDRKIHYHAMQESGSPVEAPASDLFVIRDPSDVYPDGESVIYPIAPIVEFLNYAWNTLGQQMYRTGAPLIFIRISDPRPERVENGITIPSDINYAKEIMANWGSGTAYALRENFSLEKVEVREGSLAIQSITAAGDTISNYLNPTGMLGKNSTLISGNSDASLRLLNNSIMGWITLLESQLSELPNYYMRYNGYPAKWTAKVTIPHTVIEDQTVKLQQAQLGATTRALTVNEVRELCGKEGLSSEELAKMNSEWELVLPPQQNLLGQMMTNATPGVGSYRKRRQIASACEAEMIEGVDDLERAIHRAVRNEMKNEAKFRRNH